MPDDHEKARRDWRIPDELWERIVPLLPPRKPHPLGCHRPRVDDRKAMDAIFFVLRTGCQWNALNETGSVPVVPPIAVSKSGGRRMSLWPYGNKASWNMMPCKVLTGPGSRWMGR